MNYMGNYTIDKHLNNIELLNKLYEFRTKNNESKMFFLINELANFIEENTQYSSLKNFNMLTDLLVNIINFCNSEEYNFKTFGNMYDDAFIYIWELSKDISNKYPINIYFLGEDKYSLINTVISTKVNFVGNIHINEIKSIKNHGGFNILIVSEETVSLDIDLSNFEKVIYYDKFINDSFNLVEQMYYLNIGNYDYNYLVNAMKLSKKSVVNSIFVGHSHALNGINETKLKGNVVNLSLSSQDLYYSLSIAKEIIDNNKCIKKCYIGTSYWTFYFDLSMSKNIHELAKIERIYYPIFKDSHNYKELNISSIDIQKQLSLKQYISYLSGYIFDTQKLYDYLSGIIYYTNKTYFNNYVKREELSLIGSNKLNVMDEESKYRLGKERAEIHNKMIRYIYTKDENEKIMREFLEYLNKKNVQAIIVNFPTTKYYNKFLNNQFKNDYYKIFKELEKKYKFLLMDLNNKINLFSDEDYRDLDHINGNGAKKISDIINKILK